VTRTVALILTSTLCAACSGGVNALRTAAPSAALRGASRSGAVDWPVWGFDPARSSFNSAEETLTIKNVQRLHKRWQTSFGATNGWRANSAPILLVGAGPSHQTMLYETTMGGVTFGIDANSGKIVWTFKAKSGESTTVSAPAADPSGTAIYAPGANGEVYKVNAANGEEITARGFPVQVSLITQTELNESPLNVANGYLYVAIGGNGADRPPYHGHVVSVNLSSGATTIFNTLCSKDRSLEGPDSCPQQRSGIWARAGAVVDPATSMGGRIYVATGNGDFDGNTGGYDYGDSVLALAPDLSTLLGSYTPPDYEHLEADDLDLGSTAPALLPEQADSQTPLLLVQGGKDGSLRLINRASLPGVGGELQKIQLPKRLYSAPAVWTDSTNTTWIFLGFSDMIEAYRLITYSSGVSRLALAWSDTPGQSTRGTSPVVANGILFDAFDGVIVALNATTGTELWSSAAPSAGGTIGNVHWESPIVVNGWLYCSDENRNITAYALPGPRKHLFASSRRSRRLSLRERAQCRERRNDTRRECAPARA
jgi:outer membrane protein assembly factor BamB